MNSLKRLFSLTLLVTIFFACNQKKVDVDPKGDTTTTTKPTPLYHPLTKDTFLVWQQRWNSNYRGYFITDSLHYFDMPLGDLDAIIAEPAADNARFYLGMDSDTVPHLMLLGTTNGVPDYKVIADYSKACPPICD